MSLNILEDVNKLCFPVDGAYWISLVHCKTAINISWCCLVDLLEVHSPGGDTTCRRSPNKHQITLILGAGVGYRHRSGSTVKTQNMLPSIIDCQRVHMRIILIGLLSIM